MSENPVISLHRDTDSITFVSEAQATWTLLNGSQGLGLAPVEHTTSSKPAGHGDVLLGTRMTGRDIYLPVMLDGGTYEATNAMRDQLMAFLDPTRGGFTIRVTRPDRQGWREIGVVYDGGLQGDYGSSYYGYFETVGIKLKAMDAYWQGETVQRLWQLSPGVKPFISNQDSPFFPVILSESTVQGAFEITVDGDSSTQPVWTITPPGEDLLIRNETTGERFFLSGTVSRPVTIDTLAGDVWDTQNRDGQLWDRVSLDSRLFELTPGKNRISVTMTASASASLVTLAYRPRYLAGH